MASRIGFICPTYQHDDYTARAIRSFFKHTPDGYCILVDDASPYWTPRTQEDFAALLPQPRGDRGMFIHHFPEWGGLTRSWNKGLQVAAQQKLDYCIAGNNDILFTEGWQDGLLAALDHGYALVGPVSNAPGITAKDGAQEVWKYVPNYELTDDPAYLNKVAAELKRRIDGDANPFSAQDIKDVRNHHEYTCFPAGHEFTVALRSVEPEQIARFHRSVYANDDSVLVSGCRVIAIDKRSMTELANLGSNRLQSRILDVLAQEKPEIRDALQSSGLLPVTP
jgi:glycosyltransferase involved in cell wall biosynthesis